jgi:hypothetical protein
MGTPMFEEVYDIKVGKMIWGTLQACPRTPKLNEKSVIIKIANRVLYSTQYVRFCYALIEAFKLQYKGITRLDLCYDCNRFKGGMSPARFIHQFVFSNDTTSSIIARKGRDEFSCHGSKGFGQGSKINYIAFGSPKSRYHAYIYDKTLELDQVKDKPWIRDVWSENGIISDDTHHVWRAEISIKSDGTDILNMGTGELFRLSPAYLDHRRQIEHLFHVYADKVLSFSRGTGQKRKKDYKKIELFEGEIDHTLKPTQVSNRHDFGRIEKVCANLLNRLSETYIDLETYNKKSINDCVKFLIYLSNGKRDLVEKSLEAMELDRFNATLEYHDIYKQLTKVAFETSRLIEEQHNTYYLEYILNQPPEVLEELPPDLIYWAYGMPGGNL